MTSAADSNKLQLLLRTKDAVSLTGFAPGAAPAPDVVKAGVDGSVSQSLFSQDGNILAVTDKDGVDIFYCKEDGSLAPQTRIPQGGVSAIAFSPTGGLLLTWHRQKAEESNLCVWSSSDGACRCSWTQKQWAAENWPPLKWSADGALCTKIGKDDVQVWDGTFPPGTNAPTAKIPANGVQAVYMGGGIPPAAAATGAGGGAGGGGGGGSSGGASGGSGPKPLYTIVTFTPRNKSRPGAAVMWAYPKLSEPSSARNLQSDGCRVEFTADGTLALMELTTSSSESSYYGDSRLFLASRDGRVNVAVAPPKEGPTHDFAWSPNGDFFVVIAGRSPPVTTVYNKHGAQTHSFGPAAYNTIRISPNSRIIMLGGFGNMAGNITFYDATSKKPLGPTSSAPLTVTATWSPDSRYLLTSTTRPRLQVDNGYRVWSYHGEQLAYAPHDQLFHVQWRPRPRAAFPDRAPSPARSGGAGGAAAAAAGPAAAPAPPKPMGVYRPPMAAAAAAASAASSGGAAAARLPIGAVPVETAPAKKRSRGKKKKSGANGGAGGGKEEEEGDDEEEEEAAPSAASAPAPAPSTAPLLAHTGSANSTGSGGGAGAGAGAGDDGGEGDEKKKAVRKLQKKLREIAELKAAASGGGELNPDQKAKVSSEAEIVAKLAALGLSS